MKPETLTALLMDRQLGELPSETLELLEAYLAATPAARAESEAIARTVCTARETVRRFPCSAPAAGSAPTRRRLPLRMLFSHPSLARAAAWIALAASGAGLGYVRGRAGSHSAPVSIAHSAPTGPAHSSRARFEGLWTRYQIAYDGQQRTFAVEKHR